MHAPDGFYSDSLCLVMDLACTGVLTYSLKKIWGQINTSEVLLASAVGAFGFALEMANFEVTRGSSCHFMGGVFASIVLGPYLATLVMTLAHLIQVFVFQDGGIMALGPNMVTIVLVSTFGGYYLYSQLKNLVIEPYGCYISAFLSAWLTLLITALTVCGMLSISGIEAFSATISPMLGPHVEVGIAEGVLTILLMVGIQALSPGRSPDHLIISDHSDHQETSPQSVRKVAFALLGMAFLVSLVISPFAARSAEGLKIFALNRTYLSSHRIHIPYYAPIPDYHLPGIRNQRVAKILGGTIGTVATFFLCFLACSLIRERVYHEPGTDPVYSETQHG